jgi:hypothetical protein
MPSNLFRRVTDNPRSIASEFFLSRPLPNKVSIFDFDTGGTNHAWLVVLCGIAVPSAPTSVEAFKDGGTGVSILDLDTGGNAGTSPNVALERSYAQGADGCGGLRRWEHRSAIIQGWNPFGSSPKLSIISC